MEDDICTCNCHRYGSYIRLARDCIDEELSPRRTQQEKSLGFTFRHTSEAPIHPLGLKGLLKGWGYFIEVYL